jgi:hypothetical protein
MRRFSLVLALASSSVGGCGGPHAAVEPARGRVAGGDAVRISGEGFTDHGPPVVYFGSRAAKAVVVESRSLITVLSPTADAAGEVDVSIHFSDGTVDERPRAFTYDDRGLVLRTDAKL